MYRQEADGTRGFPLAARAGALRHGAVSLGTVKVSAPAFRGVWFCQPHRPPSARRPPGPAAPPAATAGPSGAGWALRSHRVRPVLRGRRSPEACCPGYPCRAPPARRGRRSPEAWYPGYPCRAPPGRPACRVRRGGPGWRGRRVRRAHPDQGPDQVWFRDRGRDSGRGPGRDRDRGQDSGRGPGQGRDRGRDSGQGRDRGRDSGQGRDRGRDSGRGPPPWCW